MTERLTNLTLDDVKLHLRVEHDDEDLLIQSLTNAALSEIERYIGADLIVTELPADLALAVCDLVAWAYDHRADEDAKPGLTPAAARICARHRKVAIS